MLSVEQMLKIDPELASLSPQELEELRADLYGFGELAFDVWQLRKNGSNNPPGLLTDLPIKDTVETWKVGEKLE